jgi:DNA-binding MarR family transcriptional regulator
MDRSSFRKHQRQDDLKIWVPICAPQVRLNFWLNLAAKRFSERFGHKLKPWKIIPSEWAALRELYRPGRLSPLDLARALGMTKGGTSKLIDRLVEKGLVKKEVGIYDRRFRTVQLTAEGEILVGHVACSEERAERQFFRSLRLNGRHRLMDALKRTLGAKRNKYMNQWITLDGRGGQWVFQATWRSHLRRPALDNTAVSGSQQGFEFFGGQLAESPPRQVSIEC